MKNFKKFKLNSTIQKLYEEWDLEYLGDFKNMLQSIDHPVARELDNLEDEDNKDLDINFISMTNKDATVNYKSDKKIDNEFKQDNNDRLPQQSWEREKYADKIRPIEIKVGRVAQKLLTLSDEKFTQADIEIFVNKFIAQQKVLKGVDWKILKGNKIPEGYHSENYAEHDRLMDSEDTELFQSCMVDKDQEYEHVFDIYTKNPDICSLLTLRNPEGDIVGRSFLWEALKDGTEKIKIMDRVYTIKDSDREVFHDWAKNNGYFYRKIHNNYDEKSTLKFVAPEGGSSILTLMIFPKECMFKSYPYMDTFRYLNRGDKIMCNNEAYMVKKYEFDNSNLRFIELDSTDGNYSGDDGCELIETIDGEKVLKSECYHSDYSDGYILKKDAIQIKIDGYYGGIYVDKNKTKFANPNSSKTNGELVLCQANGEYKDVFFEFGDCVWSSYHKSWIPKIDSEEVEDDVYILKDERETYFKERNKKLKEKNKKLKDKIKKLKGFDEFSKEKKTSPKKSVLVKKVTPKKKLKENLKFSNNDRLNEQITLLQEAFSLKYFDEFRKLLKKIDHPIATDILNLQEKDNGDLNINYIGLSNKEGIIDYKPDSKITNKIISHYNPNEKTMDYYINSPSNRDDFGFDSSGNNIDKVKSTEIKIGRIVQKLLSLLNKKYSTSEIEDFVNKFIAVHKTMTGVNWVIVEGDDITKCYQTNNYSEIVTDGTDIANSCMNDMHDDIFDIYTKNPEVCKILTLRDSKGLIVGRSLIWITLDGSKIIDRVYTIKDSYKNIFYEWAKNNGYWYRKDSQTFKSPEGDIHVRSFLIRLKESRFREYPYFDTFNWLNRKTNVLSNELGPVGNPYILLDSTNGRYDYSDDYKIVETEKGDMFEKDCVYSTYQNKFIPKEESVPVYRNRRTIKDYVDKGVDISEKPDVRRRFVHSKKDDKLYYWLDANWSKFYDSFISDSGSTYSNSFDDYYYPEDEEEFLKFYKEKNENV